MLCEQYLLLINVIETKLDIFLKTRILKHTFPWSYELWCSHMSFSFWNIQLYTHEKMRVKEVNGGSVLLCKVFQITWKDFWRCQRSADYTLRNTTPNEEFYFYEIANILQKEIAKDKPVKKKGNYLKSKFTRHINQ